MRRHKIAAVLGTAALVTTSVLITAAPASAETTIDNVTFYTASDFGVEVASTYPANDWFYGEVSGAAGSATFGTFGITFNTGADGSVQILNQDVTTPGSAADLFQIIDNDDNSLVAATSPAPGDDWTFQLALFAEGATGFTTLRPSVPNSTDPDIDWITSGAIFDGVTELYAAGAQDTLIDLLTAAYTGVTPELLAYGVFVDPGAQPVVHGIKWDGVTSTFTPVYAPTVTPTTISTADLGNPAKGVSLAFAGAVPSYSNSAVYIQLEDAEGDIVFQDSTLFVAADGTFGTKLVVPNVAPGVYTLTFDDNNYAFRFLGLGDDYEITVTVVAALAATGVDATIPGGIAIFTLLGGSLAVFYARRRTAQI